MIRSVSRARLGVGLRHCRILVAGFATALTLGCVRIGYDLEKHSSGGASATGGATSLGGGGSLGGNTVGGASGSGGTAGAAGAAPLADASTDGAEGLPDASPPPPVRDAGDASVTVVDLSNPNQTVRSGSATITGGALHVDPAITYSAGAAYLPAPYAITATASFSVTLSFRILATGNGGDGLALIWQSDPRGTAALGATGEGIGYDGVTPSVDVEFDTLPNFWETLDMQHVAITTNGGYKTPLAMTGVAMSLSDGTTLYAWIDYDATAHSLSVYLSELAQRPASPFLAATVDFDAILGPQAYLGITAACGAGTQDHIVESLTVEYWP
jgi:hypothetical protein